MSKADDDAREKRRQQIHMMNVRSNQPGDIALPSETQAPRSQGPFEQRKAALLRLLGRAK